MVHLSFGTLYASMEKINTKGVCLRVAPSDKEWYSLVPVFSKSAPMKPVVMGTYGTQMSIVQCR